VPPRPIRELRDLTRQRVHVLEDLNRAKNRIEPLCQAGNIQISSAASDRFVVSGHQDAPGTDRGQTRSRLDGRLRQSGSLSEHPKTGHT